MIQLESNTNSNIINRAYSVESLLFRTFWINQFNRIETFLSNQTDRVNHQAKKECIDHLRCQYPRLSVVQISRLLDYTFQGNFLWILLDYFRLDDWKHQYLWLLDCLKSDAIQYVFENGVWQICLTQAASEGPSRSIKYLITYGPSEGLRERLWQQHGLVFYCGPSIYGEQTKVWEQYPFPSDWDVSCGNPEIEALKPAQS